MTGGSDERKRELSPGTCVTNTNAGVPSPRFAVPA